MASYAQRFYVVLPSDQGTCTLVMFHNKSFNPQLSVMDQLANANYIDQMPMVEALELGASLTAGGAGAARLFADKVRNMTVRKEVVPQAMVQPLSPEENARIAAMLEGINVDPSADFPTVHDALVQSDADQAAPEETTPEVGV